MSDDAHDIDNEFLRDATSIDRDFLMVANAWVRDKRIVGNPLSIYLYVRSQAIGFRISRSSLMHGLDLGRGAFETAIAKLERYGYLKRVEARWPAGTRSIDGKPLGGTKRVYWHVLEPTTEAEAASSTTIEPHGPEEPQKRAGHEPNAENQHWVSEAVENTNQPNAENQQRVSGAVDNSEKANAENQHWVRGSVDNSENPMRKTHGGFSASIRKQNIKKTNDHPALTEPSRLHDSRAQRAVGADDDDRRLQPPAPPTEPDLRPFGVDAVEVRRVLRTKVGVASADRIDLVAASKTVLERAGQTPVHPTRFVISSILAAPEEFTTNRASQSQVPQDLRGAVERLCAIAGHQWRSTNTGDRVCRACDTSASRFDAAFRAACEDRPTGHRPDGAGICRDCGVDERSGIAQRAAQAVAKCNHAGHVWGTPMPGEAGKRLSGGFVAGDEPCQNGCGAVRRDGTIGHLDLLASGARQWRAGESASVAHRKVS